MEFRFLHSAYDKIMKFLKPIGAFQAKVLLGFLFYVILTPYAALLKLTGKKFMQPVKPGKETEVKEKSFWVKVGGHDPANTSNLKTQY
ncbi:hypothetical protein H0N96_02285 [Candidatus Micrarchaeota archaeon]|nr:hypothetical protein [Candidatus Micrarchaeota archaeon]